MTVWPVMKSNVLDRIRKPGRIPAGRFLLQLATLIIIGILLGVIGKLSDASTEHLSNYLSGFAFWIALCTYIDAKCGSPFRGMAYVSGMCASMVIAYYLTAELTGLYYSQTFAIGWAVFTLISPLFAFVAWYSRGKGVFPRIISVGICSIALLASIVLFNARIYDIATVVLLAIFLLRPYSN